MAETGTFLFERQPTLLETSLFKGFRVGQIQVSIGFAQVEIMYAVLSGQVANVIGERQGFPPSV